jgi:hypothetical protein
MTAPEAVGIREPTNPLRNLLFNVLLLERSKCHITRLDFPFLTTNYITEGDRNSNETWDYHLNALASFFATAPLQSLASPESFKFELLMELHLFVADVGNRVFLESVGDCMNNTKASDLVVCSSGAFSSDDSRLAEAMKEFLQVVLGIFLSTETATNNGNEWTGNRWLSFLQLARQHNIGLLISSSVSLATACAIRVIHDLKKSSKISVREITDPHLSSTDYAVSSDHHDGSKSSEYPKIWDVGRGIVYVMVFVTSWQVPFAHHLVNRWKAGTHASFAGYYIRYLVVPIATHSKHVRRWPREGIQHLWSRCRSDVLSECTDRVSLERPVAHCGHAQSQPQARRCAQEYLHAKPSWRVVLRYVRDTIDRIGTVDDLFYMLVGIEAMLSFPQPGRSSEEVPIILTCRFHIGSHNFRHFIIHHTFITEFAKTTQ